MLEGIEMRLVVWGQNEGLPLRTYKMQYSLQANGQLWNSKRPTLVADATKSCLSVQYLSWPRSSVSPHFSSPFFEPPSVNLPYQSKDPG